LDFVILDRYHMDHLRLRSLRLVETLAETGSLHQAARRLNTSQPALTVMLQDIERTFGGKLFERSRRGLVPTEGGHYMIRQARLMLADLRRVQSEFASGNEGRALLRIGVLPLVMLEIVPQALTLLRPSHPNIRAEFREGAASELLTALADGLLDLVIGRMLPEFAANEDLVPSFLFNESFCIVSGSHHELRRRRKISWEELARIDWIEAPTNTALHDFFADAFLRRGLTPPQPVYQSASFYSCIAILGSSDCLMMVPNEVGRHFARQSRVCILPVKVEEASAAFSIIKRRSRANPQGMLAFEATVRQAARGRRQAALGSVA
jgi:DNA-binding transcriptional LysR family regulator